MAFLKAETKEEDEFLYVEKSVRFLCRMYRTERVVQS